MLGPADADDAWSDTFLSALRAYPRLKPDSNIRGWLVTIAHNRAIDQIRTTGRQPRPTDDLSDQPTHDNTDIDIDEHADLRTAVESLPPKQRQAVIYRYLADLSYADIASLLDCSQAAARRSAADGIATLRDRYRKDPTS